jgi:hypothetical protein
MHIFYLKLKLFFNCNILKFLAIKNLDQDPYPEPASVNLDLKPHWFLWTVRPDPYGETGGQKRELSLVW